LVSSSSPFSSTEQSTQERRRLRLLLRPDKEVALRLGGGRGSTSALGGAVLVRTAARSPSFPGNTGAVAAVEAPGSRDSERSLRPPSSASRRRLDLFFLGYGVRTGRINSPRRPPGSLLPLRRCQGCVLLWRWRIRSCDFDLDPFVAFSFPFLTLLMTECRGSLALVRSAAVAVRFKHQLEIGWFGDLRSTDAHNFRRLAVEATEFVLQEYAPILVTAGVYHSVNDLKKTAELSSFGRLKEEKLELHHHPQREATAST
ncbi:hypothetical protein Taro_010278, partial [Colocasia esculenta]|nr:hypothetical protein [Colocasia esculenta]